MVRGQVPEAAQKIIDDRKTVTGFGKDPQEVGPETGVIPAPPAAEPAPPPNPEPATPPETPAVEQPETEGKPRRVPLSRLKDVIADRNTEREKSVGLADDNATLRKELDELRRKQKVQAVKDGEGRPSGFEELSTADQILWLQEQVPPEVPSSADPAADDRMLGLLNERDLQLRGYSLEEAVILNEIITKNPNLEGEQVMHLAEMAAPGLFSGDESAEENGSPPSHTTHPPGSTRTRSVPAANPREDMVERGKSATTALERQKVGLDIIGHARANPQILNERGEVVG